ncbi:MAG TPA: hypothetical protein PLT75_15255 [Spirochaetota bacterium]|nr:hypothetical protein [Spirochaetota bacterium]
MFKIISRKDWIVLQEVIEDKKIAKKKAEERRKLDEEIMLIKKKDKEILDGVILWLLNQFSETVLNGDEFSKAYCLKSLINGARTGHRFSDNRQEEYFCESFYSFSRLLDKNYQNREKEGGKDVN